MHCETKRKEIWASRSGLPETAGAWMESPCNKSYACVLSGVTCPLPVGPLLRKVQLVSLSVQ